MIRVLAYNLYFGGADRQPEIRAVLAGCRADVVCLTEADDEGVVKRLSHDLGYEHYVWQRGSGQRHIATLSRHPIVDSRIYRRPPLTQAVLETRIALAAPAQPARQPGIAPQPADATEIALYNTHFLPYLLLPFEIRRWQAAGKLLQTIAERPPGPHLILGDLNAIAPGDRVLQSRNPKRMRRAMMLQFGIVFRLALPRLIGAGYVDCFRKLHPNEAGYTWMPGNLTTRYDYILADRSLAGRLRCCRVVNDLPEAMSASDHFPLMAEFDI